MCRWLVLCMCYFLTCVASAHAEEKIDFWMTQRKGANFFNQTPSPEWFIAAQHVGIQFARLAPDKWQGEQRDFLLGNADDFQNIPTTDFNLLKKTIDDAHQYGIKIVITMLSLPGSRWRQNNEGLDDLRLWTSKEYHTQAANFWKQLAALLKDHPAVVGYNILNEPHPECLFGIHDFREVNLQEWHASVQGSFADLNIFYKTIIQAIREVDSETPIIVDTGLYATPWAIRYLQPIEDSKTLYSFHMYEPYAYTTRTLNTGRYEYPGAVPIKLTDTEKTAAPSSCPAIYWNKSTLIDFLKPISDWQEKFQIPSSRILVGEFGCDRTAKGASLYLGELIQIFDTHRWHWAFYSFREDCWDSMDYELGSEKVDWQYWEALEQKRSLDPFRHDNPLFDIIKNNLQQPRSWRL